MLGSPSLLWRRDIKSRTIHLEQVLVSRYFFLYFTKGIYTIARRWADKKSKTFI